MTAVETSPCSATRGRPRPREAAESGGGRLVNAMIRVIVNFRDFHP